MRNCSPTQIIPCYHGDVMRITGKLSEVRLSKYPPMLKSKQSTPARRVTDHPRSISRNAGIVEPNSRRSEVGKDRGIFMPPSQVGSRDYVLSHSFIWYKYSYPVCSNPILPAPLSNNPIFSSVYKDRKTLIHRENQNLFPPPSPFHWW